MNIMIIVIFTIYLSVVNGTFLQINQKLSYCNVDSEPTFWNRAYPCDILHSTKPNGPNIPLMRTTANHQTRTYTVLHKRHDLVSGKGIECVIIKHTKKMTMSFFGTAYTETETYKDTKQNRQIKMNSKSNRKRTIQRHITITRIKSGNKIRVGKKEFLLVAEEFAGADGFDF